MGAPVRLLPRRHCAPGRPGRASVAAWPDDDPLHPYVLALHAFGLEESGRYAEAEASGRQALARDARVPWAIHAVAHVMEMQGRHEEGLRWMDEHRAAGARALAIATAHRATASPATSAGTRRCSRSKTSTSGARSRVFDDYLGATRSRSRCSASTPRRCSGASRLLDGDVGTRWRTLLAGWRSTPRAPATRSSTSARDDGVDRRGRDRRSARLGRALARRRRASRRLERRRSRVRSARRCCSGLLAFGEGRYEAATELIAPLRDRLARSAAAMRNATSSTRRCSPRRRAAAIASARARRCSTSGGAPSRRRR